MTTRILIAGFGGQGVLFAGKVLAYAGMLAGKQVSWLPSYGPEMRGGTANCSVIISDSMIGSPIVTAADILIAMNLPSLDKYEGLLPAGASVFADGSLVERDFERKDVKSYKIPATGMASDQGLNTLANMILMGKMLKECPLFTLEEIERSLKKVIPAKHMDLLDKNIEAIKLGFSN